MGAPQPTKARRRRRQWGAQRRLRHRIGFDFVAGVLVALMMSAWTASIVNAYRERSAAKTSAEPPSFGTPAPKPAQALSSSLADHRTKETAYLEDLGGYLGPLRGRSGKLQAVFRTPGAEVVRDADPHLVLEDAGGSTSAESAPAAPGIYRLAVELDKAKRPIADLKLITLVPFSRKKDERIGLYYLGRWPYESGGTPRSATYANPSGFIEVTRQNKDTPVSAHFRLGQFLTKDQFDVWPKYLLLEPKLLDKLELAVQELEKEGVRVDHVHVMSGFRTPRYNKGGGNTGGRANLSRHMYGDGADVYVDNDRNGAPDDITGDGRVDTEDAEKFGRAVERVERTHPPLVGGIGIYKACCGHGPFTHVDTRGYRARWRGEGPG